MARPVGSAESFAALRVPEFRLFLAARACLVLSLQVQMLVVGWQIYQLTKDPLMMGLVGLAEAIPNIMVSLYAGHVADSVRRRKIILLTEYSLFFCSFGLCVLAWPGVMEFLHGFSGVWLIFGIIFISGIARGFLGPAVFAFLPQVLNNKSIYPNAVSWNSTVWQTASVIGPAMGGYLLGLFEKKFQMGEALTYTVDVALLLASVVLFLMIKDKPLPESTTGAIPISESLKSGVKFVFAHKTLLAAMSLDLFAVLFGGAVALLPIFAEEILKVGPEGFGWLRAAPSIGSVVMALFITFVPVRRNAGRIMLYAVAGFGVCTIAFAYSVNLYLSLALLCLAGMFDAVSVIVRSTLVHTLTPEHMKGRVSSVNNIFIGSSNEIGSFESGATAKLMGPVTAVAFGGVMTLVVVVTTWFKAPTLRNHSFEE